MLILPFNGLRPRIHRSAFIAPNATIIGDVEIGPDASVFYGTVLRADVGASALAHARISRTIAYSTSTATQTASSKTT